MTREQLIQYLSSLVYPVSGSSSVSYQDAEGTLQVFSTMAVIEAFEKYIRNV